MTTATIGTRYQVVIPRSERQQLRLRPHSKVAVSVEDGAIVIRSLDPKPCRCIGRDLADGVEPTDCVKHLRAEWAHRA